jgi:hypothetical protein
MNQRTLLYIVVAVVVLIVLAYGLGWFGGAEPPAATTAPPATTTTPPATGTGTTQ